LHQAFGGVLKFDSGITHCVPKLLKVLL